MNCWIITWEGAGDHVLLEKKYKIAAIVNYRRTERYITDLVEFLYYNSLDIRDRIDYARNRGGAPYKAYCGTTLDGHPYGDEFFCGHNPWLHARRVNNLHVLVDEDGNETLTWEEIPRPKINK